MKPSKYNYVFYDKGYGYWFNSLNISFFRISANLSKKIETILNNGDINIEDLPFIWDKLHDNGFIVDDNVNEVDIVRKRNKEAIERPNYSLTILPTLNCNFKCWYCIQDHLPSIMSDETKCKIKKHLEYMIQVKKIKSLTLDWFGGEPFMFYHQVIKPISLYAKELCSIHNIPFYLSTTTNGYFINKEVGKEIVEMGFRSFQITLDGNKEYHDKVKFQNGCESTFDHVLRNIDGLISNSKDVFVSLRINYANKNLTEKIVEQVNKFIQPEHRSNITISPHKVWQEEPDPDFKQSINRILDRFNEAGYKVQRWNPAVGYVPCYASREYFTTINYNGHLLKCTACDDLYLDSPRGEINDDGSLHWNDNFDIKYKEASYENERCLNCKSLPLCMGRCPRDHFNGYDNCKYDNQDETLEDSIFEYLKQEYHDNE